MRGNWILLLSLASVLGCSARAVRTSKARPKKAVTRRRPAKAKAKVELVEEPTVGRKKAHKRKTSYRRVLYKNCFERAEEYEIAGDRLAAIRAYSEAKSYGSPAEVKAIERSIAKLVLQLLELERTRTRQSKTVMARRPASRVKELEELEDFGHLQESRLDQELLSSPSERLNKATGEHGSFLSQAFAHYGTVPRAKTLATERYERFRRNEGILARYKRSRLAFREALRESHHKALSGALVANSFRGSVADQLSLFGIQNELRKNFASEARLVHRIRRLIRRPNGRALPGSVLRLRSLNNEETALLLRAHLSSQLKVVQNLQTLTSDTVSLALQAENSRQKRILISVTSAASQRMESVSIGDLVRAMNGHRARND